MRIPTIVSALALAASTLAAPFEITNATLAKKDFENAKFTWYDVGLGACGGFNSPPEHVVALNIGQWDGGAHCWTLINISAWGKTTQAAVVDQCPGCPWGALDLSTGLFNFLTWDGAAGSSTDPGVIYGNWDFA